MDTETATSAEFADELYSYLDSSGGMFRDIILGFEKIENKDELDTELIQDIMELLMVSDENLGTAFNLVDEEILEHVETDGLGNMEYEDKSAISSELNEVNNLLTETVENVDEAYNLAKQLPDEIDGFEFGAYDHPVGSIEYIQGQVEHMDMLSDEMS